MDPDIMKEKLDALIEFQTLETVVARLSRSLEKIPQSIEALDALFLDVKQKLSGQNDRVEQLKKTYRSQEREVETILERIKKSRTKMDAVKTNKEYQSILLEIEDQEKKQSEIEDQMLMELDAIESEQGALSNLKEEMSQLEKTVALRKAAIQGEADEISQALETAKGRRDEQHGGVDAKMLDLYNRVKLQVGAVALVPVTNGVCKGCHLTIPPQMYNELQRQDSLKFCPHCHRMIYWLAEET
jgi:uncharacterized protein